MTIKPFRALRPVRDKVHLVATRPFYTYKKNVLRAKMQSNPYSFLHIINPDFELLKEDTSDLNRVEKHNFVKEKYHSFIENGVLIRDEIPTLYIYRQTLKGNVYTGIIAATSVDSYNKGKIKKHEATITAREVMFTDYLDTVGYNAEPVLLAHAPSDELNQTLNDITSQRPEYEFSTADQVKHELWLTPPDQCSIITELFEKIGVSYIADGHHRCASSAALNERRKANHLNIGNDGYFLSYIIDETKLKVFEYNRLIKNKTDLSVADVLSNLETNFDISPLDHTRKPNHEHEIIMITQKGSYSLTCNKQIIELNNPVKSLDAEILTNYVLSPIFGIEDLKTNKNVGFISGKESTSRLHKKMTKGGFDFAFLLYPVRMEQVKKVADTGMIMPPKSTWVEPKLRSGLTVYCINE